MKVAIVTPLYPPDIAQTASYVKELGTRLAKHHDVTILTYGHAPERIQGVTILYVNKRTPLVVRLPRFFLTLLSVARKNDVLYVINGPSVELPLALMSLLVSTPYIFHTADTSAHAFAQKHFLRRWIETFVQKKAHLTETNLPLTKPEILPFTEMSTDTTAYERSWSEHIQSTERALENTRVKKP